MEPSIRNFIPLVLFSLALPSGAQITEQEPNDNYAQANFLPASTTINGVTCWAPEADYFFIVPPTDGVMRLITNISAATPAPIPDDLRIAPISDELHSYGDAMPTVGANDVAVPDTFYWSCMASDTVFLYMHNSTMFNGYCYTYAMRYEMIAPYFADEVEPNNSVAEALPLPYDTELEGHLGFITDPAWGGSDIYDFFRIVLPDDGTLRVIMSSENTGGLLTPINVHLDGVNAQPIGTGLNGEVLTDTVYWTCLNADTFHLRLAMPTYTDCGVSYRIRYDLMAPAFADDAEPNNEFPQATPVLMDVPVDGHLRYGWQTSDYFDIYRVVKADTGHFRIISEATTAGITLQGLRLQVYDHTWTPIGSPVASVGEAGAVVTDTSTILTAPIDTLYIRVSFEPGDCGAYRLWFSTLSTVGMGPEVGLPLAHALRVFPDPAAEELTLTYELTSSQRVRIRLLDMHGRVVHTMAEEVKPPGEQRTVIDTRPLASGAYTVEVSASDGTGARQLIIVRH